MTRSSPALLLPLLLSLLLLSLAPRALARTPGPRDDAYRAGRRAYEEGQPDARQHLEAAVAADPDHGEAHLLLADVALEEGDLERARAAAERAVALLADRAAAHEVLGSVRLATADLAGAEAAFARALELDERASEARCGLGRVAYARGDLPLAEEQYRAAARLDRRDPLPLRLLGAVLLDLERFDEAVAELDRAHRLDRGDDEVRAELAYALWAAGRLDQAAAHYRALARDDDPAAFYSLGLIEVERGREREALSALREAVRLDPAHADSWTLLGRILAGRGERTLAEECFARAAAVSSPAGAAPGPGGGEDVD